MKTALIEISTSHEECLFSQALFMEHTDFALDIIIHPKLENQIRPYKNLFNTVFFVEEEKGLLKKVKKLRQLLKILKSYKVVIFNTASSSKLVRNTIFLLNFYPKIKCIGVLHNTEKLNSSFTQKIISTKIKKYFVLADHLVLGFPKKFQLQSFYPIFFPPNKKIVRKEENEIWITIPGRIDFIRRNYTLLFKALENIEALKNVKFIFLGGLSEKTEEGNNLISLFKASKFLNQIIYFNRFIENEEYHAYLAQSDIIMPLLKTNKSYLRHKISGSFNLAYAHKKPLLVNEFFTELEDFSQRSIFFNDKNLSSIIESLDQRALKCPSYKKLDKWSFQNQKSSYLRFLRSS